MLCAPNDLKPQLTRSAELDGSPGITWFAQDKPILHEFAITRLILINAERSPMVSNASTPHKSAIPLRTVTSMSNG